MSTGMPLLSEWSSSYRCLYLLIVELTTTMQNGTVYFEVLNRTHCKEQKRKEVHMRDSSGDYRLWFTWSHPHCVVDFV